MSQRTLSQIADLVGAELVGDPDRVVSGVASLAEAGPDDVCLFHQARFEPEARATRAAALVTSAGLHPGREDVSLLVCADASRAFTRVVRALVGPRSRPEPGVHPTAVVHADAVLGTNVAVGALCVVGAGARLAPGVVLHPGVVVGAGVSLGADTEIHPSVVLYEGVTIGERCVVHSGTVIGADGYGYEPEPGATPADPPRWVAIPQVGTVVLEDEVDVGANCTIDRARIGVTRIGAGTKLDDLVHVAHNVQVGRSVMMAGQVGIAGSACIEDGALLGGQVGVTGHRTVGRGARLADKAGVIGDVPPGEVWFGYPARPRQKSLRARAALERLPALVERVKELEARLARLEAQGDPE